MNSCRILFFSTLKDAVGTGEMEFQFPDGATMENLFVSLCAQFPRLVGWKSGLLMAVNQEYVKGDCVVPNGAEIAFMPPVQGG